MTAPARSFGRVLDAATRHLHLVVVLAVSGFLFLPVVVITVLSFSNERQLVFPPRTWGMRQYQTLTSNGYWRSTVVESLSIALPVAVITLAIGVPLAYAITRTRMPGRGVLRFLSVSPLIIPATAYAVAMYVFFLQVGLVDSPIGLIFSHVALGIPFVVIIVSAALVRISIDLEMVAMTLGASRIRAAVGITGRLLIPALVASFIFVFVASFDDATFVNFVSGPGIVTLPKAIFESLKIGIDPAITAVATILMVATGVVMSIGMYLRPERRWNDSDSEKQDALS